MNFYKEAANMLDKIESKKASIKGCLSLAAAKDRKRLGALIIGELTIHMQALKNSDQAFDHFSFAKKRSSVSVITYGQPSIY